MPSFSEVVDPSVWEEVVEWGFARELVTTIAARTGRSNRSVQRMLGIWKQGDRCHFNEAELTIVMPSLEQAVAKWLAFLKRRYQGLIVITDDASCEAVRRQRAQMTIRHASSRKPLHVYRGVLKTDILIVAVFRNPHLSKLLEQLDPALHKRATHQAALPVLKKGDRVLLTNAVLDVELSFVVKTELV
jgi:hypothetical protein